MSEQTDFLKDLKTNEGTDAFEHLSEEENETKPQGETEETEEESEFKARNRRERRLLTQNQRLREEAIAATARAQALSEARRFTEEIEGSDYIKEVRAIYGDDSPEKKMASDILENTLRKIEERAVEKASELMQSKQEREVSAIKEEEDKIDRMLEDLEDEHGVDFSRDDIRKGYLTLLERLSPKDSDGNIIEYADPNTVYEIFESRQERNNSRARDLASRSMTRSGASSESKLQDDSTWRALKDAGIF